MSDENIEALNRFGDAQNRRDVEAMLKELDPEVEWHSLILGSLRGEATVFRGHDGVRELLRDLYETFAEFRVEYSEVRDLGDRLVAFGRWIARGEGSGAKTTTPIAVVVDIKNGKAIRLEFYRDPKEALEAAGLREQAMSQDNVEVVRALLEAFNRGDLDAMLELATDDVDVRPPSHLLDGIVFRGHAGTRTWMERTAETWREIEVSSAQLLATAGEHVVMAQDVRTVGHDSGVPVSQRYIYVYTLRGGKIAAAIAYPGEAEALEAAGLRE